MGDSTNSKEERKFSSISVNHIGKKLHLDSTSPVRRSVIETGSPKVEVPVKLNQSFMSGKIKLQNSRPVSTASVPSIDENKVMDINSNNEIQSAKNKDSDKVRNSAIQIKNRDIENLKKGDLGSGRFERQQSTQKVPLYTIQSQPGRKVSSQEQFDNRIINNNHNMGHINNGYVPSRPVSTNGGSVNSLPVYREQYCFYTRWSKLEKILLLIIFVLCFIIACLLSLIGFLSKRAKYSDDPEMPTFLRPLLNIGNSNP